MTRGWGSAQQGEMLEICFFTGPEGLFTELKKRLINRVLESELTTHLGDDKHERPPEEKPNARNGHSQKTLRSDDGELPIKIPALERG